MKNKEKKFPNLFRDLPPPLFMNEDFPCFITATTGGWKTLKQVQGFAFVDNGNGVVRAPGQKLSGMTD